MADKSTMEIDAFLAALRDYQKENTEYSNVYYQLGLVEFDRFASVDPVIQRVASRQYIYNAKTNFGLAKNYFDDKDISRNPDWYNLPDLKDRDSLVSLGKKVMDEQYENSVRYAEAYEELVFNHDRAVSNYLQAREGFIEINTSADNLRQLFLGADDSLKIAVKDIGNAFDSCIFYLDEYRKLYQELPYKKKRKVHVNLNTIDHFRMNGITPTNFLADEIEMWDYREWSDRFNQLLEDEVDGLHKEIEVAFKYFTSTTDEMLNGDDCLQADLDNQQFQRIINLITKYDPESVLIDIFYYLTAKLEFGNQLAYETNCNEIIGAPSDDFMSRKGRIYKNLFESYVDADSLIAIVSNSREREASFEWFFQEVMTDSDGSNGFASRQKVENEGVFKSELTQMDHFRAVQTMGKDSLNLYFQLDRKMLVSDTSGADTIVWVTKGAPLSEDRHLMLAAEGDQNQVILASPIDTDFGLIWSKPTYKNSTVSFFKIVSDSAFVISGTSGKTWAQIMQLNGAEQKPIILKTADPIIDVKLNELQGELTIVQQRVDGITINKANFSGKITSSTNLPLMGTYLTQFTEDQNTWIFGYTEEADATNITARIVSTSTGELVEEKTYQLNNSLLSPYLIKNDNETITLISRNADSEEEHVYAIMNYEGIVTYEEIF